MDRYISRNRLDSHMSDVCKWCRDTAAEFDGIMPDCEQCPLHRLKEKLEYIPVADVKTVVKGKWLNDDGVAVSWAENAPKSPYGSCSCSVCGEWLVASDEYNVLGQFCPNCGADMRGIDNG